MSRLLLLLAIAGLGSCTPEIKNTEVYSVLYDTTDPLLANPKAASLWDYTQGNDSSKDLVIRYGRLSDVDINITRQIKRPAVASGLFSNAVMEKKGLDDFKEEFYDLINSKDSIGASHSAIFKPILSELDYLSNLPDNFHKELIVYSNLLENSDWMSFYSGNDLWLLENKSEKVIERYLDQLTDGTHYGDIKLTIVYIPKDFTQNRRFKKIREVYTHVFNQIGVDITFSANLVKSDVEL